MKFTMPRIFCFSGRSTAGSAMKKGKSYRDDDEDDMTGDMEDPTSETNIQEVPLSKTGEIWGMRPENLSLWFRTWSCTNQATQSQKKARRLNFFYLKRRGTVSSSCVAKTKALIIAQLIYTFVFAYTKIRFSHNVAHVVSEILVHQYLRVAQVLFWTPRQVLRTGLSVCLSVCLQWS